MNPQPDTLHDRITALIAKAEASVRASFPSATAERMIALDDTDARLTLGDLRAVLAETATAQPEADAVERVISEFRECVRYERDGTSVLVPVADLRVAYRALAAQPVEPADLAHVEPAICDGSDRCPAAHHVHGCYADAGACESPDEHPPVEPEPDLVVHLEDAAHPSIIRTVEEVATHVGTDLAHEGRFEPEPFMPGPGHSAFCGNEQPHARHRHPLPDSYDVCEGVPPVEPEPDDREALVDDVERILRTSDRDGRALVREVIDAILAALAAAQPVEPEANEQAAHDRITALVDLHDRLVREDPVEPEPDEREALACRTFDDAGTSVCDRPARFIVWGHLYEKRHKGPKCARHLPPGCEFGGGFGAPAIYEIPGFRRSRPEATHTVTAEQRDAAWQVLARHGVSAALPSILAALGVTVTDTPGDNTCWCPQCGKDH